MNKLRLATLARQFLTSSGWFRSVESGIPVDARGPVPWFTCPAIRFLNPIAGKDYRVLEFGSGSSTHWWSERGREVVSVEHDPGWAHRFRETAAPNVSLIERTVDEIIPPAHRGFLYESYFPLGLGARLSTDPMRNHAAGLLDDRFLAYATVVLDYPKGHFDIILVDGMARILTAWLAAACVSEHGLIVFDNSDRNEYGDAYAAA